MTVVDPPLKGPDGGRSADIRSASRVGGSTTVWVFTSTLVDLPRLGGSLRWLSGHGPRRRPDGGRSTTSTRRRNVGRSTIVCGWQVQVDHRRPPSTTVDHRRPPSTTVDHRRPPSTTVDHRRPPSTTVDHRGPPW